MDSLDPDSWVAMVSTVVTPREILAGTASMLIQKDTQERMTMRTDGIYVWSRKNPYCRLRLKVAMRHGKLPGTSTQVKRYPGALH